MHKNDPTPGGLVRFHTAHKLTLMAHGITVGVAMASGSMVVAGLS